MVNTQLAHPIMLSKEPLQLRRQVESALARLVWSTFSSEVVKMEMAYLRHFQNTFLESVEVYSRAESNSTLFSTGIQTLNTSLS